MRCVFLYDYGIELNQSINRRSEEMIVPSALHDYRTDVRVIDAALRIRSIVLESVTLLLECVGAMSNVAVARHWLPS